MISNRMKPIVNDKYSRARHVLNHIDFRKFLDRLLNMSAVIPNCSLRSFNSFNLWPFSTTFSMFIFMLSTTSSTCLCSRLIFVPDEDFSMLIAV